MIQVGRGIPCHLVAGPLGVGKTSAILDYLKNKEDDESIAVLVNDFGANGLDGVILKDEGTPAKGELVVTPVPGGCLCCTSSIYFEKHLKDLAGVEGIDRIIIEPSGIVMLDQMKALLMKLGATLALDIQPIIVLVNVARFNERHFTELPYFRMMAREADILVGNRCDLANDDQVESFLAYAETMNAPEKQVYTTTYGRLPVEAFAPGSACEAGAAWAKPDPVHQEQRQSGSREWTAETRFDHERLMRALDDWKDSCMDRGEQRLKGTLRTDQGWKLIEVAQGQLYSRPFPDQEMNRADWILSGSNEPDEPEALLMAAMVDG